MDQQDLLNWGTLLLGPLGLFIAIAAWRAHRRRSPRTAAYAVLGVLVLSFHGVMLYTRWDQIVRMFRGDFTDPEAQARLEKDKLASPEYKPGDWPQWRGMHRDGVAADRDLLAVWPKEGPAVVWRRPIGGGFSSISIWNGRLYTMDRQGGHERVLCLDAVNGKDIWVHTYEADYDKVDYGAGPRATPTVHGGMVYTVGATGIFQCLTAAPADNKPRVLWEHDLTDEYDAKVPTWGVACSPLIEGDLVIVQPGGKKGSVVAFHRESGEEAWTSLDDPSGYSSPIATDAAGHRQIVCFTGTHMVGLRIRDGKLLWKYEWKTEHHGNIATPIVRSNYAFLSSGYSMGCALLELSPDSGGVASKEVFYRKNKLMRNHHSSCVLYDGHLYGFDYGTLKCVNLRTFEEAWSAGRQTPEKGCLIYADGHLIVLTEGGKLVLVEATPGDYRKKSEFQLFDGSQCWALPAISEGRMYVRSNSEIVCLDLRKR